MSHDYENQLPPEDSLVEGDPVEDANIAPDRPTTETADALTASERAAGETIDDRLPQEEPDDASLTGDEPVTDKALDEPDNAAAEEQAMHVVEEPPENS